MKKLNCKYSLKEHISIINSFIKMFSPLIQEVITEENCLHRKRFPQ